MIPHIINQFCVEIEQYAVNNLADEREANKLQLKLHLIDGAMLFLKTAVNITKVPDPLLSSQLSELDKKLSAKFLEFHALHESMQIGSNDNLPPGVEFAAPSNGSVDRTSLNQYFKDEKIPEYLSISELTDLANHLSENTAPFESTAFYLHDKTGKGVNYHLNIFDAIDIAAEEPNETGTTFIEWAVNHASKGDVFDLHDCELTKLY